MKKENQKPIPRDSKGRPLHYLIEKLVPKWARN